MSMISEMLKEEHDRLARSIAAFERMIAGLPKGAIVWKDVGNNSYPYLQWREKSQVRSQYIKKGDLAQIQELVIQRQEYERNVSGMKASMKEIERMLGRRRGQ